MQATNDDVSSRSFGADPFGSAGEGAVTRSVDADLVARAKAGDREAEEALYRRHVRHIAGLVGRLLGDRVEAEDCIQETFLIALDRVRDLRDGHAVRAWLAQIAVSQVRRRFRKKRLLRAFGLDRASDDVDSYAWTGAAPDVHAELARLRGALASLPTEERIAWSLRHVEGHALEDVAAMCGCSLATAKRRIVAAQSRVRARLDVEDDS